MRIIAHLDMDAFFAAVEERDHPRFRGKPVVVGADPEEGHGRGVVSTANYKAREYGIHSALPISKAWQLAEKARAEGKPRTIFTGGHFRVYGEESEKIIAIVRKYSPLVEVASVDEAYSDLSLLKSWAVAEAVCRKIKAEIKKKRRLTCSIGLGPNKLIAKIASDMQKPDGLTIVRDEEAEKFLEPLPMRKIPGIGPKTEKMFNQRGDKTVKDLKKYSRDQLRLMMGKWGVELYDRLRGIDDSPIVEEYEAKSIGEQETFRQDTLDANFITERLRELAKSVIRRFMKSDFQSFRTVGITVRFEDFETKTRAHTLFKGVDKIGDLFNHPTPKKLLQILEFEALRILAPFLDKRENPKRKKIRLIGVRVEKLE